MALRNIITNGDPILRKESKEVKEITERVKTLISDMWDTMYDAGGIGLAAPQVGVLKRVVVINAAIPADEDTSDGGNNVEDVKFTLINPEIIETSEEYARVSEGCLSVPGFTGKVRRPVRVKVRALNENGEEIFVEGQGMLARALSHEIDHLHGIIYTDIAEDIEEICEEREDVE